MKMVSRVRKVTTGHSTRVNCLAFSPCDRYFVTGSQDDTVRIHTLSNTPQPTSRDNSITHNHKIRSLAFSFDSKWMGSINSNGHICIWDLNEKHTIACDFTFFGTCSQASAFTPDGSFFVYAERTNCIVFWSQETGRVMRKVISLDYASPRSVGAIAFSPDRLKMAVCSSEYGMDSVAILDIGNDQNPFKSSEMRIDYDSGWHKLLGYHPSSKYLCLNGEVWHLIITPPYRIYEGRERWGTLEETFSIRFEAARQSSATFGAYVFSVPPLLQVTAHSSRGGLLALGADDGRILVLDFTHCIAERERDF